jgi:hypothetical protein
MQAEVTRRQRAEQLKGGALQRGSRFLGGLAGTNMIQPVPEDIGF